MQTTIKEKDLIKEIIVGLDHIRCYGFRETLRKYSDELISADEALSLIKEFNQNYIEIDKIRKEKEGEDSYLQSVKIGETDIPMNLIKTLTKTEYYDFSTFTQKYGIVVNASANDYNPFSNIYTYYNSERERDLELMKLKDLLAVLGLRKFN